MTSAQHGPRATIKSLVRPIESASKTFAAGQKWLVGSLLAVAYNGTHSFWKRLAPFRKVPHADPNLALVWLSNAYSDISVRLLQHVRNVLGSSLSFSVCFSLFVRHAC